MLEFHDRIAIGNGISRDAMLPGASPEYGYTRPFRSVGRRSIARCIGSRGESLRTIR